MYLMRLGPVGSERPVVRMDDSHYLDVSDVVDDFDEAFFGSNGLTRLAEVVRERSATEQLQEFGEERIGAPIARPHQILCIGLNYSDHAAEPVRLSPTSRYCSPSHPTPSSARTTMSASPAARRSWIGSRTWNCIGRRTSYLDSVADAQAAIAGYTVVNDVSERAFQIERGGQWSKGKSAETFNPAGPWLVTPNEIDDVRNLRMWLDVSGVRRQDGSTATMIFDPYVIVHYLSHFLVLEPGDLIDTGTPPGVGMGMRPPVWLKAGDVMELGVEGLGSQRQTVIPAR